MQLNRPLSEHDLDRLAEFLDSDVAPDAMDLFEAHGLITAVVSMPEMIMPSTWQPLLFGGQPEFASFEDAQEIIGLMMRLHNQIADELREGSFVPLGYPDSHAVQSWCRGYLRGAKLDRSWKGDEGAASMMFPAGVLSGAFDLIGQRDSDGNIITDPTKHIELCRARLPEYVQRTHDYFLEQRRAPLPQPSTIRAPKIGRNDPCPCGSGKKYKKCCLSLATH